MPSVVGTDASAVTERSWVDDASVSEYEHDQLHSPAAVGLEACQERRVGCPLGERDLGLAVQCVSRDGDLDQERWHSFKNQVSGRVYGTVDGMGSKTRSRTHTGTGAARLPDTIRSSSSGMGVSCPIMVAIRRTTPSCRPT